MIDPLLKLILEPGIHSHTSGSNIRMALSLSPDLLLGPLDKRQIPEVTPARNGLLRTRLLLLFFIFLITIIFFFYLIIL